LQELESVADSFIRVRLTRIDDLDLRLFDFDYDLTLTFFFLDADGRVYARYGGRDAENPDRRQSLAGLRYTMESVLAEHRSDRPRFALRSEEGPRTIRDVQGGRRNGCFHCHQVKEILNENLRKKGEWTRDLIWRYPLPENVGVTLDVDRGNVVRSVEAQSPAAAAGVLPGDRLRRAGQTPIHSIADLMFALDRAPRQGKVELAWQRGTAERSATLVLAEGWRRTDLTWRPSVQHLVPSVRLYGKDLTAEERQPLGLSPRQLAFKQNDFVPTPVQKAGIRGGDIILGIDGKALEMDVVDFIHYVQRHYLVGDRVVIDVIRNRERMHFTMELLP
jgi:hypothetical protein